MEDMTDQNNRKDWLGLMARAPKGRVTALMVASNFRQDFNWLRQPEIGSVMVRGRAGATGAPFNLGEMTVTRCSLQLPGGEVGHAYIQGRDKQDAEAAALTDALMQTKHAQRVETAVLTPLSSEEQTRRTDRAEKAAATKVDFFTMARGEDK
jgi:alpha-D-ribose 1-methylphosphonate 5-triphosphate synthase subunit PhnG